MTPAVSVIIPTYNGSAYIQEALASVYAQTLPAAEVIVVDDCSTDGTAELVQRIAESMPLPIRVIRQPRNSGGPARPINVGIASARFELITVLDQDDVLLPGKIESQARVLLQNPNVSLAASFCAFHATSGDIVPWQRDAHAELLVRNGSRPLGILPGREVLRLFVLRGNFLVGYPGFMFRMADWRHKGGVDERLPVGSDYEMVCWLCTRGDVAIEPVVQYLRREHDVNICNDRQKVFLDMTRVRGHVLARHRWLLEDDSVAQPMREWFVNFGYWLREAGNYRDAWACSRLLGSLWGWDVPSIRAACKLIPHWAWRKLTKHAPIYNDFTRRGISHSRCERGTASIR